MIITKPRDWARIKANLDEIGAKTRLHHGMRRVRDRGAHRRRARGARGQGARSRPRATR